MANRALFPGIKKTEEENFMWKEAFHNGFCTVFKLNSLSRLPPNGSPGPRGPYYLPLGDQNFKQGVRTGALNL